MNAKSLVDALESILVTIGDIVRVTAIWSDTNFEFKIVQVVPSAKQDAPFVITQKTKFSIDQG